MDFNLLANATRGLARAAAAGDASRGAAGASRVALTLQALLPVVEAHGAQTQFARDLRALVADAARGLGSVGTVFVVQPAGSGALRVDIGRQFLTVPPTLRDAVLALAQAQSHDARGAAGAAPGSPAPASAGANAPASKPVAALTSGAIAWAQSWTASAQAGAIAAAALPRALRAAAGVADARGSTATVDADVVLFDEASLRPAAAAARLRGAVETSGLFFESHLAQWSAGTRSAEDVAGELARLQRHALPMHAEDAPDVRASAASLGGDRVAAQLDVLQKSAFALNTMAWAGQLCTIEFRKEGPPDRHAQDAPADSPAVVVAATVTLDLPRLGPVDVNLRLSGSSIAVMASALPRSRKLLAASLEDLGEALRARGLSPAALQVRQPE